MNDVADARGGGGASLGNIIRFAVSVVLGVGLLVLVFYDVDLHEFLDAIRGAHLAWWAMSAGAFIVLHSVRAFRWYLIVRRIQPVSFREIFSITCVGFLAIQALPFRLGEFARPYLLLERRDVPFGSAMYTVVLERTLDIMAVGVCFAVVVLFADIPLETFTIGDWEVRFVQEGRKVIAVAMVPFGGCLLLFLVLRQRAVRWTEAVMGRLHRGMARRVAVLLQSFLDGVETMADWRFAAQMISATALLWVVNSLGMWFMTLAFHFEGMSPMAGLVLLVVLIIGIMLPAPPLFAGVFEAFIIGGLALYGVPKDPAAAYAVVCHTTTLVILFSLGALFLWVDQISFRKIIEFARTLRDDGPSAESS